MFFFLSFLGFLFRGAKVKANPSGERQLAAIFCTHVSLNFRSCGTSMADYNEPIPLTSAVRELGH